MLAPTPSFGVVPLMVRSGVSEGGRAWLARRRAQLMLQVVAP
jgi:hypothetical protein